MGARRERSNPLKGYCCVNIKLRMEIVWHCVIEYKNRKYAFMGDSPGRAKLKSIVSCRTGRYPSIETPQGVCNVYYTTNPDKDIYMIFTPLDNEDRVYLENNGYQKELTKFDIDCPITAEQP